MRRRWELRYQRSRGFGLFAACPLRAGEIVERYEEKAHVLVSRRHVERSWQALWRQWFHRYAWPVTNNLNVMWSDDPEDWRPINHACDPNTWLDGLDLVARRDIRPGEELTVDYATFWWSDHERVRVSLRILGLPPRDPRHRSSAAAYTEAIWRSRFGFRSRDLAEYRSGLTAGLRNRTEQLWARLALVARRAVVPGGGHTAPVRAVR